MTNHEDHMLDAVRYAMLVRKVTIPRWREHPLRRLRYEWRKLVDNWRSRDAWWWEDE